MKGGKEIWVDADLDTIPLFIKEGAVIPKYPVQQYVGEKEFDKITLEIYFKEGKERSELYDDAHDGLDYKKGRYSLRTFKVTGKKNEFILQQHKEGKYDAPYDKFTLVFMNLPFDIETIQVDNVEMPLHHLTCNGASSITVDKQFTEIHLFGK